LSWSSSSFEEWARPRVLELVYTARDIEGFATTLGYFGPPFKWDIERRELIRAELDAAMFHLYGLDRDDVEYVMNTFSIVRRKDEKEHEEYRTRRLILERYDALALASSTRNEYQAVIESPPGHSSLWRQRRDDSRR
jgi:hypothetical protein